MRLPNREELIGWGKVLIGVGTAVITSENPFTWRSIVGYVISAITSLSALYQGSPAGNVSQITPVPAMKAPAASLKIPDPVIGTVSTPTPITNNAGQLITPGTTQLNGFSQPVQSPQVGMAINTAPVNPALAGTQQQV